MSAYTPHLPGSPCWTDIASDDPAATAAFYTALFGWEAEPPNEAFGGYFNFRKNGVRVAGASPKMMPDQPTLWSVYLLSTDAKQTVDRARAAGSTVIADAMDVATLGTMAVVIDPTGAGVGIWQPGDHKGFGLFGEHGAPGWFELHTREYDRAVAFYRDVFDWTTEAMTEPPGFQYTVLKSGEEMAAGIYGAGDEDLPAGVGGLWKVYWAVDDTDAAVEKARGLGATVVMEPVDTPYGRHAELIDPQGAQFKLVGPNDAMPAQ